MPLKLETFGKHKRAIFPPTNSLILMGNNYFGAEFQLTLVDFFEGVRPV